MTLRVAIIDTNVVVAGLLTREATSPTARILDELLRGGFPFLVSPQLLAEYRAVLLRPRIHAAHALSESAIDSLLTTLVANAIVREPGPAPAGAPDPGDQHLWDLLAAEPRAVLVSGDARLHERAPVGGSVVSPRAWIDSLAGGQP